MFLFCIILIVICTLCEIKEIGYEFLLKSEDIENLLSEKELNWRLEDTFDEEIKDSVRYVFADDTGMQFIIRSTIYDSYGYKGERGIGIAWSLPRELSIEKTREFYYTELPEIFDLINILYGNTNRLKNGLIEFVNYYKKVENDCQQGMYWEKRAGDNHICIDVLFENNKYGSLSVYPNEVYEGLVLPSKYEDWKQVAETDSIEIKNMTVDEISKMEPVKEEDFYLRHFVVQGYLEDVEDLKTVPETLKSLKVTRPYYFKPNKDKYLSAKLIDETGSMDVFVQSTSLNKEELGKERNHNVVLYYHDKETPIFVIRFSPLADKSLVY